MTSWPELVSTALVGSERRRVLIDVDLLDGVDLGSPEASLLVAAGVMSVYRSAGRQPQIGGNVPAPAAHDPRPVAPAAAAQLLELLLSGDVRVPGGPVALVDEWLRRCARSDHRVPNRLVPPVLDAATADDVLRAAAIDAAGPLATWLAERNPAWEWGGAAADLSTAIDWETATTSERLALLDHLRRHEPERARSLISGAWSSEPAASREAMVSLLAQRLSPADEPLLERALDDRAKGVRASAADLLDRLPSSARAQRMAQRLERLVRVEGRVRKDLVIDLPPEPDDAARRDGVTDARFDTLGLAASWLVRLIAGAPLEWWTRHIGREVEWIVERGRDSKELMLGWSLAAVRQRDLEWADALLDVAPRADVLAMLAAEAPDRAATRVRALLPGLADAALFPIVAALPGPWPRDVSSDVVQRYAAIGAKAPLVEIVAPVLTRRLHPDAIADVERWASALGEGTRDRRTVRDLHHALSIRRTIAEELA